MHYAVNAQQIMVAWDYDNMSVGLSVGGALPGVYIGIRAAGNITGGVPSTFTWDQVACVYTNAATTLFVNGAQVATAGATGALSSRNLYLGRSNANGLPFTGQLSEVSVFPTALSAARILAHFNAITHRTALPVYRGMGGYTVLPPNGDTSGLEAEILRSVRKTY
jgi:Concanavalin A-like lectin/glucanases superfamily